MRVSVVINTVGRPRMLGEALASLKLQTLDEFEVLVVAGPDAGKTRRAVHRYPGARVIDCPWKNLSVSRNLGWRSAGGELVAFMDDDALALPSWLEDLRARFVEPDVAAAGGFVRDHTGARYQWQFLTIDRLCNPIEMRLGEDVGPLRSTRPIPGTEDRYKYPAGTNMMFRRDALAAVGGFDESFVYGAEDAELCLRLYDRGYHVAHVPSAEVIHHYAPSHQRDHRSVPTRLEDPIRSFVYFKLRHGVDRYGSEAVLRNIGRYLEDSRAWVRSMAANGTISAPQRDQLLADVESGSRQAFARRLKAARPMHVSGEHRLARDFKPYLPEGMRERRLRLCFVSKELPPNPSGGIGVWIWTLARALAGRGHDITVVTRTSGHATHEFVEGCWVDSTPDLDYSDRTVPYLSDIPYWLRTNALRVYDAVARLEYRRKFDAVFSPIWEVEGLGLLRARKGLNIVTLHTPLKAVMRTSLGWKPDENHVREVAMPIWAAEAELVTRADRVLANSRGIVEEIERSYQVRIAPERLRFVAHGIGDPFANGGEAAAQQGSNSPFKRVLFVGRFDGRKGVDLVLGAAPGILQQHPDAIIEMCGEPNVQLDDGSTYFGRFRERHGHAPWFDRVLVRGRVDDEELLDAYASCDIFVAPSRFESFGLIYLEAMRFSKPVVALNYGGAREIVRPGKTGVLVDRADSAKLCEAVCRLLDDDGVRERMGQAGRKLFLERYTADRMAREVESTVREAIGRRVDALPCVAERVRPLLPAEAAD